jgi:beta-hydroxylase
VFIDPTAFPFTAELAAGCDAVRRELDELGDRALRPWHDRHLYDGESWKVFGLYAFGRQLAQNCRRCPETTRLVEAVPGMLSAGFSRLEPGAHIRPHRGLARVVFRCQLGLRVAAGCALRVVGDRIWCRVF